MTPHRFRHFHGPLRQPPGFLGWNSRTHAPKRIWKRASNPGSPLANTLPDTSPISQSIALRQVVLTLGTELLVTDGPVCQL